MVLHTCRTKKIMEKLKQNRWAVWSPWRQSSPVGETCGGKVGNPTQTDPASSPPFRLRCLPDGHCALNSISAVDLASLPSIFGCMNHTACCFYAPDLHMKWGPVSVCLSVRLSVSLSVCHVPRSRPNSKTERPRKSKIGKIEAYHTDNPWTYLEVKTSKVKVTRPLNA